MRTQIDKISSKTSNRINFVHYTNIDKKAPWNRQARQTAQSVVAYPNPAQQKLSDNLYDAPVADGFLFLTNLAHSSSFVVVPRYLYFPLTKPVTNPHRAKEKDIYIYIYTYIYIEIIHHIWSCIFVLMIPVGCPSDSGQLSSNAQFPSSKQGSLEPRQSQV